MSKEFKVYKVTLESKTYHTIFCISKSKNEAEQDAIILAGQGCGYNVPIPSDLKPISVEISSEHEEDDYDTRYNTLAE